MGAAFLVEGQRGRWRERFTAAGKLREVTWSVSRQARQETYGRTRLEAWRGNGDAAPGSFDVERGWSAKIGQMGEKIKVNRSP